MSVNVVEEVPQESHNPVSQRCDRCGAQGYVVAKYVSPIATLSLVFCNHHGVESKDKLEAQGFVVTFYDLS